MDLYFFNLINSFAQKWAWLDFLAVFFAKYSGYFLVGLLTVLLLIKFQKHWKMIVEAFVSGVLARFVITEIIRFFWQRQRPFETIDVNLLLQEKIEPSFPSGHAAFYFALATIVYFYNKQLGYLFFVVSFLMGLVRIFVGYHWPLDILSGATIGIISAWLINKLLQHRVLQ